MSEEKLANLSIMDGASGQEGKKSLMDKLSEVGSCCTVSKSLGICNGAIELMIVDIRWTVHGAGA